MRYDFGNVYKEIRESKGLTQEEVCGDILSRTSLSKIESGKTTPKYENMEFLLRQVNMTFEEFDYICHLYHPSERSTIMQTFLKMASISGTSDLSKLLKRCQHYLKTHHDFPIQQLQDMLEIVIYIRENGIEKLSSKVDNIVNRLWDKIEKQDTWYESDLKVLNTILFAFPMEYIHQITEKILERLEVYKHYSPVFQLRMMLLLNLSTLYLYNGDKLLCKQLCYTLLEEAKVSKQYDTLAFSYIRIGICANDAQLIQNGLSLAKLVEDEHLLTELEREVNIFVNKKESH